jgi:predicted amidohydrolase
MNPNISRRKFVQNASLGIGAGSIGMPDFFKMPQTKKNDISGARTATIGTISVMEMRASSPADMVNQVLKIMEGMTTYKPDIICLPEVFAFCNLDTRYKATDVAESAPGTVVTPFTKFAATHKCYVICPTYTKVDGNVYISAVLIDRAGKVVGEYHKIRPTAGEMELGVKPGPFDPPVFDTDFGKIGIQICFDVKWEEGWNALKRKGAEIVFWPSAYAAGREIASRAWRHQVYVVSSTAKDTSKICDITGETIAQTGRWQRNWTIGPVNLEKAFVLTWPAVSVFPDIQKKIWIKNFAENF